MRRLLPSLVITVLTLQLALDWGPAAASQITLVADRDNSMFAESNNSAGLATTIFAGRNNPMGGGNIRRALLHFDIAGSIPSGSIINSVSLTLHLDGPAQTDTTARIMGLHRATADWGEGTSGGGGPGTGMGQAPTTGDATWNFRFFNTQTWTTAGGDFNATASGTTSVGFTPSTFHTWNTTANLVADVQGWLDTPNMNFGWILRGVETSIGTSRRFQSREATNPLERPMLTINFETPFLPEPSTGLLIAAGLAGLWLQRRQRAR